MKSIIRSPFSLFLLVAVILILLALICSKQTIDIHIHDTYYIITFPFVFFWLSVPFFFFWLIYLISRKILLSNILVWAHFCLTVISLSLLLYFLPYRLTNAWTSFETYKNFHLITSTTLLAFLLGQTFFLINVIGGSIKALIK